MRRFFHQPPITAFSSRLLIRLLSMLTLLVLIFTTIQASRDARHSAWSGANDSNEMQSKIDAPVASPPKNAVADEDSEEFSAAKEEFAAVVDREPLSDIEMPAYWRLVRWSREESLDALKGRSSRDLLFTNFVETPAKLRGKPVQLKLHLMRSLSHSPEPNNSAGVPLVYEGWGCTDESRTNPYCVVFTERPGEMPIGPNIREDVTFYGYFFKLLSYEAQDDKRRMAPLLIGRLVWHPSPATMGGLSTSRWFWPSVTGGLCLLTAFLYVMQRYANYQGLRPNPRADENVAVSHWLKDISTNDEELT